MRCSSLTEREQSLLLEVAAAAIDQGLAGAQPGPVAAEDYPPALRECRSSFVTLKIDGRLRGCIGGLEARLPLVADVAEHAYGAAFRDPRFPPLTAAERQSLEISLSLLTAPEPFACSDEAELLERLEPGLDGLVVQAGRRRGTFLPSVWESLPDPRDFVHELKRKAGLNPEDWPADFKVYRYRAEHIP